MLALVLLNIAGVAKNVVATAQETGLINETTYLNVYLQATGEEVVWDDPWESDDETSETGDGLEIFALNAGSLGLLISVLRNGLDTKGSRHIVLEEFAAGADEVATLDRGAYENISYSLDLANVGGTELGAFTLFRGGSGNTPTFVYLHRLDPGVRRRLRELPGSDCDPGSRYVDGRTLYWIGTLQSLLPKI